MRHTAVTIVLIDRLVIFCCVYQIRRIQVHRPSRFSADRSTSLWETRMADGDFTSVRRHASKNFAHLFVTKVKRYNIGWTVRIIVIASKMKLPTHSSRKPALKSIPSWPFSSNLIWTLPVDAGYSYWKIQNKDHEIVGGVVL